MKSAEKIKSASTSSDYSFRVSTEVIYLFAAEKAAVWSPQYRSASRSENAMLGSFRTLVSRSEEKNDPDYIPWNLLVRVSKSH